MNQAFITDFDALLSKIDRLDEDNYHLKMELTDQGKLLKNLQQIKIEISAFKYMLAKETDLSQNTFHDRSLIQTIDGKFDEALMDGKTCGYDTRQPVEGAPPDPISTDDLDRKFPVPPRFHNDPNDPSLNHPYPSASISAWHNCESHYDSLLMIPFPNIKEWSYPSSMSKYHYEEYICCDKRVDALIRNLEYLKDRFTKCLRTDGLTAFSGPHLVSGLKGLLDISTTTNTSSSLNHSHVIKTSSASQSLPPQNNILADGIFHSKNDPDPTCSDPTPLTIDDAATHAATNTPTQNPIILTNAQSITTQTNNDSGIESLVEMNPQPPRPLTVDTTNLKLLLVELYVIEAEIKVLKGYRKNMTKKKPSEILLVEYEDGMNSNLPDKPRGKMTRVDASTQTSPTSTLVPLEYVANPVEVDVYKIDEITFDLEELCLLKGSDNGGKHKLPGCSLSHQAYTAHMNLKNFESKVKAMTQLLCIMCGNDPHQIIQQLSELTTDPENCSLLRRSGFITFLVRWAYRDLESFFAGIDQFCKKPIVSSQTTDERADKCVVIWPPHQPCLDEIMKYVTLTYRCEQSSYVLIRAIVMGDRDEKLVGDGTTTQPTMNEYNFCPENMFDGTTCDDGAERHKKEIKILDLLDVVRTYIGNILTMLVDCIDKVRVHIDEDDVDKSFLHTLNHAGDDDVGETRAEFHNPRTVPNKQLDEVEGSDSGLDRNEDCDMLLDASQYKISFDLSYLETCATSSPPISSLAALLKLSYDEEHRSIMSELGGGRACSLLVQLEYLLCGTGGKDNYKFFPLKFLMILGQEISNTKFGVNLMNGLASSRRFCGIILTNLTFSDTDARSLLCSQSYLVEALIQLFNKNDLSIVQISANLLRNLTWKPTDPLVKVSLTNPAFHILPTLLSKLKELLDPKRFPNTIDEEKEHLVKSLNEERTIKVICAVIWNLTSQPLLTDQIISSWASFLDIVPRALSYPSPSNTLDVVENVGGILKNISSVPATMMPSKADLGPPLYPLVLDTLIQHLRFSPSLTLVSNACLILRNLTSGPGLHPSQCRNLVRMLPGSLQMLTRLSWSRHPSIYAGANGILRNVSKSLDHDESTMLQNTPHNNCHESLNPMGPCNKNSSPLYACVTIGGPLEKDEDKCINYPEVIATDLKIEVDTVSSNQTREHIKDHISLCHQTHVVSNHYLDRLPLTSNGNFYPDSSDSNTTNDQTLNSNFPTQQTPMMFSRQSSLSTLSDYQYDPSIDNGVVGIHSIYNLVDDKGDLESLPSDIMIGFATPGRESNIESSCPSPLPRHHGDDVIDYGHYGDDMESGIGDRGMVENNPDPVSLDMVTCGDNDVIEPPQNPRAYATEYSRNYDLNPHILRFPPYGNDDEEYCDNDERTYPYATENTPFQFSSRYSSLSMLEEPVSESGIETLPQSGTIANNDLLRSFEANNNTTADPVDVFINGHEEYDDDYEGYGNDSSEEGEEEIIQACIQSVFPSGKNVLDNKSTIIGSVDNNFSHNNSSIIKVAATLSPLTSMRTKALSESEFVLKPLSSINNSLAHRIRPSLVPNTPHINYQDWRNSRITQSHQTLSNNVNRASHQNFVRPHSNDLTLVLKDDKRTTNTKAREMSRSDSQLYKTMNNTLRNTNYNMTLKRDIDLISRPHPLMAASDSRNVVNAHLNNLNFAKLSDNTFRFRERGDNNYIAHFVHERHCLKTYSLQGSVPFSSHYTTTKPFVTPTNPGTSDEDNDVDNLQVFATEGTPFFLSKTNSVEQILESLSREMLSDPFKTNDLRSVFNFPSYPSATANEAGIPQYVSNLHSKTDSILDGEKMVDKSDDDDDQGQEDMIKTYATEGTPYHATRSASPEHDDNQGSNTDDNRGQRFYGSENCYRLGEEGTMMGEEVVKMFYVENTPVALSKRASLSNIVSCASSDSEQSDERARKMSPINHNVRSEDGVLDGVNIDGRSKRKSGTTQDGHFLEDNETAFNTDEFILAPPPISTCQHNNISLISEGHILDTFASNTQHATIERKYCHEDYYDERMSFLPNLRSFETYDSPRTYNVEGTPLIYSRQDSSSNLLSPLIISRNDDADSPHSERGGVNDQFRISNRNILTAISRPTEAPRNFSETQDFASSSSHQCLTSTYDNDAMNIQGCTQDKDIYSSQESMTSDPSPFDQALLDQCINYALPNNTFGGMKDFSSPIYPEVFGNRAVDMVNISNIKKGRVDVNPEEYHNDPLSPNLHSNTTNNGLIDNCPGTAQIPTKSNYNPSYPLNLTGLNIGTISPTKKSPTQKIQILPSPIRRLQESAPILLTVTGSPRASSNAIICKTVKRIVTDIDAETWDEIMTADLDNVSISSTSLNRHPLNQSSMMSRGSISNSGGMRFSSRLNQHQAHQISPQRRPSHLHDTSSSNRTPFRPKYARAFSVHSSISSDDRPLLENETISLVSDTDADEEYNPFVTENYPESRPTSSNYVMPSRHAIKDEAANLYSAVSDLANNAVMEERMLGMPLVPDITSDNIYSDNHRFGFKGNDDSDGFQIPDPASHASMVAIPKPLVKQRTFIKETPTPKLEAAPSSIPVTTITLPHIINNKCNKNIATLATTLHPNTSNVRYSRSKSNLTPPKVAKNNGSKTSLNSFNSDTNDPKIISNKNCRLSKIVTRSTTTTTLPTIQPPTSGRKPDNSRLPNPSANVASLSPKCGNTSTNNHTNKLLKVKTHKNMDKKGVQDISNDTTTYTPKASFNKSTVQSKNTILEPPSVVFASVKISNPPNRTSKIKCEPPHSPPNVKNSSSLRFNTFVKRPKVSSETVQNFNRIESNVTEIPDTINQSIKKNKSSIPRVSNSAIKLEGNESKTNGCYIRKPNYS